MQATIASESWFTRTTNWTAQLKSTATTAVRPTTGGMSSTKHENGAGITATDGGTNMSIVGMTIVIGTITTMTGTKH
jgi:hypothetical protein